MSRLVTPYKFGLHVDEADFEANLAHAEELAGRKADVVLLFAKLTDPIDDTMQWLMSAGYEVALTLEFWDGREPHDPAYSLREIAAGRHDAELDRWLRACRDLPRPVHLRVLHEGNSDWYPWGAYAPTNRITDFVPAWRHVINRVHEVSGDRAVVQWCVNRRHGRDKTDPLATFYPGDEYVDEFAINGYNRLAKGQWKSFTQIISPFYQQLETIGRDKPLWIGETASTERGGDKAAWIKAMFDTVLSTMPVACLTWFNEYLKVPGEPDRDWPFDTSPASLRAFQAGVKRTKPLQPASPTPDASPSTESEPGPS